MSAAVQQPEPPWRPRTRAECPKVRPCPYVGCRLNTYLQVLPRSGKVKACHDCEPWEVDPRLSCALDVAERGQHLLEEVGEALGITRERVRQIEADALWRLATDGEARVLVDWLPEDHPPLQELVDHTPVVVPTGPKRVRRPDKHRPTLSPEQRAEARERAKETTRKLREKAAREGVCQVPWCDNRLRPRTGKGGAQPSYCAEHANQKVRERACREHARAMADDSG